MLDYKLATPNFQRCVEIYYFLVYGFAKTHVIVNHFLFFSE